MKAAIRFVTAVVVLAACVVLGVGCSKNRAAPTGLLPMFIGVPENLPPAANSPAGALRLFQYCWRNRDVNQYASMFTDDFCFKCSARDSAGSGSGCDFGRGDELQMAEHLFEAGTATDPPASSIRFDYTSDLVATPDPRPGKDPGWHKQIRAQALLRIDVEDRSNEIKGPGLFYLVRGDSASIPPDLVVRGFAPDPNRWYIEAWQDETTPESGRPAAATPAHPLPTRNFTWCDLKTQYR